MGNKISKRLLAAVLVLLTVALFASASSYAQSDNTALNSSRLWFNLPATWTSTNSNGMTTYTSPDNNYTLVVYPYSGTSDYTSEQLLQNYLRDYKWTADNAYNPYTLNGLEGYSTTAHSSMNGNDVTGYMYYGYDPKYPNDRYYYYMYTPTSNWSTGAAEMQKMLSSAKYNPVNPNLQTK